MPKAWYHDGFRGVRSGIRFSRGIHQMVRQDCLSRHDTVRLLVSKLRPRLRPTCSDTKQPQRLSNLVELTPGSSQSEPRQGRMDGTSRTLPHEQWHGFNRWSESPSSNHAAQESGWFSERRGVGNRSVNTSRNPGSMSPARRVSPSSSKTD